MDVYVDGAGVLDGNGGADGGEMRLIFVFSWNLYIVSSSVYCSGYAYREFL